MIWSSMDTTTYFIKYLDVSFKKSYPETSESVKLKKKIQVTTVLTELLSITEKNFL